MNSTSSDSFSSHLQDIFSFKVIRFLPCCSILLPFIQIFFWENRINIYDGTHEIEHMKINEVYGNPKQFQQKSISTSEKSMFIDLRKQYGLEELNDYKMNFTFVALIKYKKIDFDCQTWLNIKNSTLISPNHPNSINCNWLITSNFRSYIILDFNFIEVKSKNCCLRQLLSSS